MQEANARRRVERRVVLHFPGFEPLDAAQHRARFERSAQRSAKLWDFRATIDPLQTDDGKPYFDVACAGDDWRTSSRIYILDHNDIVGALNGRATVRRLVSGYVSAARVVLEGGATAYFAHAWRFGLFFVFPFLITALALLASSVIAAYPYWFGLSPWHWIPGILAACFFFFRLFLPWSGKLHTLHLFDDWGLAVAMARLDRPYLTHRLEECARIARTAFAEEADEYVVSSHSMGANFAAHVIGMLLEREPGLLDGKRVVFVPLGGAILQCALLRSARTLRARVGLVARAKEIVWFEVHCLTDMIHFYKSRVVALAGHPDAPQPRIAFIRIRHMLSAEHYQKIKLDFLRVHRQYVLGSDMRAPFDFALMTAGPLPAISFADFSRENLPEL